MYSGVFGESAGEVVEGGEVEEGAKLGVIMAREDARLFWW